MKWMNQKGIWLSGYFLIMMFLFTRGFYTTFFVSLIGLLLLIVSFNEDVRLLAWMIISFFLGNLLLVYTDNFIESFHISPFSLIIVSQLLSLIPILMICYVIKQFKQEINIFINKPNFIGEIHLPFRMVFSIRRFTLLFSILAVLSVVGTLFLQKEALHWRPFLLILLFSIINAVLEEVLW
ncbi:MAG: hypothetical protein ACJ8MO_39595, partial [Bacillus sp. (in: firmicutes)]